MSDEVKEAIAVSLMVALAVAGICQFTRYEDGKDAEWKKFVMEHHCKATRESGMNMSARVWACDGFDVEHN